MGGYSDMIGVLKKVEKLEDMHIRRTPREDEDRDESDTSIKQRLPQVSVNCQQARSMERSSS